MKEAIAAAAREEIDLHGLRFTMQDLATRMRVSKRSLYANFASKEELIGYLLDEILSDVADKEKQICSGTAAPAEKLQQILLMHSSEADMFSKSIHEDLKRLYPRQYQKIQLEQQQCQQDIEELLAAGMRRGELRAVNVEMVSRIIRDAFDIFSSHSFLHDNSMSYTDAMNSLLDILLRGIMKEQQARIL